MPELITKSTHQVEIRPGVDDADSQYGSFDIILSAQTRDRDGDVFKADEWKQPLPSWIPIDVDHGMSVEKTVGSGEPFLNDDGDLQVRGTYASTALAQQVRTLVAEGHCRYVSVAVMTDKSLKDGTPNRELLNGAFVNTPSNREAVILSSKSINADDADAKAKDDDYDGPWADPGYLDSEGKPAKDGNGQPRYKIDNEEHCRAAWSYINMPKNADQYTAGQLEKIKNKIKAACRKFGIEISEDDDDKKSLVETMAERIAALEKAVDVKAGARNSAQDSKMIQAIHDASSILGADCVSEAAPSESDGSSEGANKSVRSALVIGKSLNGSLEDMQSRLQCALNDACGAGNWDGCYPWIVATYCNPDGQGGSVVYQLGGETVCRAFSDDGACVCLDSNIQVVTVITTVAPVPDTVDGDRVMLPPAAAEASKSVAAVEIGPGGAGGSGGTLAATDAAMDMDQFKAQLDAITAQPTGETVESKSSGPDGSGLPAEPATDVVPVSPDSKAAPEKGPADSDESADADDEEAAEADTPNDDESQSKRMAILRMRILAANARADALAS